MLGVPFKAFWTPGRILGIKHLSFIHLKLGLISHIVSGPPPVQRGNYPTTFWEASVFVEGVLLLPIRL